MQVKPHLVGNLRIILTIRPLSVQNFYTNRHLAKYAVKFDIKMITFLLGRNIKVLMHNVYYHKAYVVIEVDTKTCKIST